MKIRTQFIISTFVFGAILLVTGVSAVITYQQVQATHEQETLATSMQQEAFELSILANEYLLYRESHQVSRWESKFAAFSNDLARLNVDRPEQQALVNNIKANRQRLQDVFSEVRANLERIPATQGAIADPGFVQVSWSRLQLQNQAIIFDAARLSRSFGEHADWLLQATNLQSFGLVGILGAFILTNFLLIFRRTLESLAILQVGTRLIGAGNLDHAIAEVKNDEIGELSHAFNQMTANLKATMASKAELEHEVGERRRAEEHISHLNKDLEGKSLELQTANRYLEELLAQTQAARIELQATNKELEAFVYSVAHDLRAPLHQITELSRVMLADYGAQLPADSQPLIQIIHDHAVATNRLAEDLLTLSRVTQAAPAKRTVHMTDLVRQVLTDLRAEQEGRPVEIRLTDLPAAQADPVLVKQVWVNLIANALKFTRAGEQPRIEISWRREKEATVYYVKDNGAGFDMAQVDRLFRAFHRLHHAEEFEGNGLGLAIVQRIVERHGGRAWAQGAVGQGAVFNFTLERAALGDPAGSGPSAMRVTSPTAEKAQKARPGIRVLVVDDHQLFRQGLRILLMKATDIQIVGEARDGKEAIELAQSLQPDVILMDIEMPGMNGVEATQTLKATGHPARILMLTMKTDEDDVRKASQSGAEGYVVKNSDRDEVIEAIRAVHQGIRSVSPSVASFFSKSLS